MSKHPDEDFDSINKAIPPFPIPQDAKCPECGVRAPTNVDHEWLMTALSDGVCSYSHTIITKGPKGFVWAERIRLHVFHTIWDGKAWVAKGEVKITGHNRINERSPIEL